MTRTVLVIVHPRCTRGRRRRRLDAFLTALECHGIAADVAVTHDAADATARVARDGRNDGTPVAAVGGDGTLHAVVQGLAARTPPGAPLDPVLPVPCGTGNDLAFNAGLPRAPAALAARLAAGTTRAVDLGHVVMHTADGVFERRFVNVFGLGFEAAVNRHATAHRRWLPGALHYLPAVVRALSAFGAPESTVELDAPDGTRTTQHGAFPIVTVGNGARCGGGFHLVPDARIDDGALDALVVAPISTAKLLWLMPKTFWGGHRGHPAAQLARCTRVRITCAAPVFVHCDGEVMPAPVHTVEIVVEPRRLVLAGG